ncbi:MAG: hypothetical protein ACRDZX_03720 [Acidimicrobiales bacterium]
MANTIPEALQPLGDANTADDVFGDLEAKTAAAIAEAVDYRRRHGLSIAVDRGKGVEILQYPVETGS